MNEASYPDNPWLTALAPASLAEGASPGNAPALPMSGSRIVNVATETQLQTAMANLREGGTLLLANGTYRLTSSLYINNRHNVTIRSTEGSTNVVLLGKGMDSANSGNVPFGIWPHTTAIDQAPALPSVTNDLDGDPRPQGVGYDIGADEFAPKAVPRFSSITVTSSNCVIGFMSVAGLTYDVLSDPDPVSGPWPVVRGNLSGNGGDLQFVVTNPPNKGSRFFRVRTTP